MRLLPLVLLALFCSACQTTTGLHSAVPEPPAAYSFYQSVDAIPTADRWWLDFGDDELNRLQTRLFADNLSLQQAFYRLEQLEARSRLSASALWPTVNASAGVRREQTVGGGGETQSRSGRLAVAAAYEVDVWQRLRHRATAADLRLQAGEDDIRTLMLTLSARLAELYFIATEQRAQLALVDRRLDHHRQLVGQIEERYRVGLTAATELYQARQNLAQMEASIPQYQTTLAQTENAISLLLGQPPGTIRVARRTLPQITEVISIGLPADLIAKRPDITAALRELEATDYELAAAVADRLPRLDLTANLGRSLTRLSSGDVTGSFWSLALGLAQPLVDGGRLAAAADQQQAIRNERLIGVHLKILTAIEEVESALTAEINSARREQFLLQQQQLNQSNLQLRRENYLQGLSDSLELLRSEMDQLAIQSQQLANQRQWLSHRISLVRALGGHWMAEELARKRPNLTEAANLRIRATGNEPGWLVDISEGRMQVTTDYGQTYRTFPVPEPERDTGLKTVQYRLTTATTILTLELRQITCQDTMSGDLFPLQATLKIDGQTLPGCADIP